VETFQNVILRNSSDKFNNFEILHVKEVKLTPKSKQDGEKMLSYS